MLYTCYIDAPSLVRGRAYCKYSIGLYCENEEHNNTVNAVGILQNRRGTWHWRECAWKNQSWYWRQSQILACVSAHQALTHERVLSLYLSKFGVALITCVEYFRPKIQCQFNLGWYLGGGGREGRTWEFVRVYQPADFPTRWWLGCIFHSDAAHMLG
jgi:hypothetical protein